MRRASALLLVALLASVESGAQEAPARGTRCKFDFSANHPFQSFKLPSGQYNVFTGGNVVATCKSKGMVVKADSIEYYGDDGRTLLVGHVDYREPRLRLKSDLLTYFENDERILATQNVDAQLPSGSTIRGPVLDFLRAVPRLRPRQSATASGRPTITLVETDASGKAQPPVRVTGNTVWLQGDSVVSAQGQVTVVRPELTATGDSLYGDSGTGLLRIMRGPRINGTKGRPFTLVGETIDLLSRRRKLERVLSKNAAQAVSEDLDLKSDSIDLRVTDDLLQRAVAWGASRARATSPTQTIISDSIDVLLPGQRVRELHAVRRATAEGVPDTTKFRTTERDRLTGDTIVARFDSIPARDTSSKPRIRLLTATGNATSLQHLPPQDTTLCVPAVNYVRGRLIRVTFDSAQISRVVVTDTVGSGGVYLEPKPDSASLCRRGARPGTSAGTTTGGAASQSAPPPRTPAPTSSPTATPAVIPRRP